MALSRFDHTHTKTARARKLRQASTPAERVLWSKIRLGQIAGHNFRRQHPMGAYVLDFYCPALGLAIELDGGQHGTPERSNRDKARDAWLRGRGIQVLRYWNSDVFSNLTGVLAAIRTITLSLSKEQGDPSPPLRGDPPLSEEGEGVPGEMPSRVSPALGRGKSGRAADQVGIKTLRLQP